MSDSFHEKVEKKLSAWSASSGGGIETEKNGIKGIIKKENNKHRFTILKDGKVIHTGLADDEWEARNEVTKRLR